MHTSFDGHRANEKGDPSGIAFNIEVANDF
jgi:hypothetical protein